MAMGEMCSFCRKKFLKQYKAQKFCSLLCANRFNLNNKNKVILPKRFGSSLAEFFGIILGDGCVVKYFTKIYLNRITDKEYAVFVYNLAKDLFPGASISKTPRISDGTEEIQISAKDVCDYLRRIGFSKERKLPSWILKKSSFITATIRGLFDTEGSIGVKRFRGKKGNYFYHQLTFTNKNPNLLKFIEVSLRNLGFKPTRNSKKNIYISNKCDIERYFKEIGSDNPKLTNKIAKGKIYKEAWQSGRMHRT